jgi:hypothetical protein
MNDLSDIAHLVELSVAPVFLLAGIGALLNVVTARLGRVVDRARNLEERFYAPRSDDEAARIRAELGSLDRRMLLAQRAIFLFSTAALLICLVVASIFIGEFVDLAVPALVAVIFIATMFAMIAGLALFLMEISIATKVLRVRADLFAK